MAAMEKATALETITQDEFDEMVRAWATWTRIRYDIQTYLTTKGTATGRWYEETGDFLDNIDANGISTVGIDASDSGEWNTRTETISADELLDIQARYEQYVAIAAVANELRVKESEERARKGREDQYKKLKEEFEGGLK